MTDVSQENLNKKENKENLDSLGYINLEDHLKIKPEAWENIQKILSDEKGAYLCEPNEDETHGVAKKSEDFNFDTTWTSRYNKNLHRAALRKEERKNKEDELEKNILINGVLTNFESWVNSGIGFIYPPYASDDNRKIESFIVSCIESARDQLYKIKPLFDKMEYCEIRDMLVDCQNRIFKNRTLIIEEQPVSGFNVDGNIDLSKIVESV